MLSLIHFLSNNIYWLPTMLRRNQRALPGNENKLQVRQTKHTSSRQRRTPMHRAGLGRAGWIPAVICPLGGQPWAAYNLTNCTGRPEEYKDKKDMGPAHQDSV